MARSRPSARDDSGLDRRTNDDFPVDRLEASSATKTALLPQRRTGRAMSRARALNNASSTKFVAGVDSGDVRGSQEAIQPACNLESAPETRPRGVSPCTSTC